ncbi:MAG: Uma2 family endonuclease [Clostridiales bacterium]|nr:Uma2 family endonuclease [Clostridiales bacterium]
MEALKTKYYTYEEWLSLDDGIRSELFDGKIAVMPLPLRRHQEILSELHRQLANFLKGKPCKVFPAPFAVRLTKDADTAVQPDITVICDPSKLTKEGCTGAPDMIVEISALSTSRCDKYVKFNTYLQAGVREYWIVDLEDETISVYTLKGSNYVLHMYGKENNVNVSVLEGCIINLTDVLAE